MNIFLPTDFSDCSKNAGIFAATHLPNDSEFTLIHAIDTPQAGATLLINLDQELRSLARENMESMIAELTSVFPTIAFKSIIKFGSVNQVVNEIVEADDLIVVGTTGATGISSVIGSNTSGLIKYAKCPLISVPALTDPYKPLKNAMFSTDFKNDASSKQLDKLEKLLSILKLKIEVLHVTPSNVITQPIDSNFPETKMLNSIGSDYDIHYEIKSSQHLEDIIIQKADQLKCDSIIAIPHHLGVIKSLFHRSIVKKLTLHSHLPIIVIR